MRPTTDDEKEQITTVTKSYSITTSSPVSPYFEKFVSLFAVYIPSPKTLKSETKRVKAGIGQT
jgi:hypothetical protein